MADTIPHMYMSILYLAANVLAFLGLWRAGYYRTWRMLGLQIALTCWQVSVILVVGTTDRTTAIHWWLPGDLLLIGASAGAILEAWWRALDRFPRPHRWGVLLSFGGTAVFTGLCLRWLLPIQRFADWFEQVKADRLVWNLCTATLALGAFGIAMTFNRRNDPRYVRMHTGLLAVLSCGHVLLADLSHWNRSRALYRALEIACLLGWVINATLLRREISGLSTPARGGASTPRSQLRPAVAMRSHALAAPAWPGYHRAEESARAWTPASRAET